MFTNKRTFNFWCLLLCFFSYTAYCQNQSIADSLERVLSQNLLHDSIRFQVHRDLGHYHPIPTKAVEHSERALEIALKMKDLKKQAVAFELIGLGERLVGNKVRSYEAIFKALEIADSLDLKRNQGSLMLSIAANMVLDNRVNESYRYFRESQRLFNELGDDYRLATVLVNLGEAFRLNSELDSSNKYFSMALRVNENLGNEVIQAYSLGNLGMTHHAQGKLEEALPELEQAVEMLNELGDPASVVIYDAEIGQILIKQGQEEEGIKKIVTSFELAKSENLKEQIKELSSMLTQLYSERGVFDQAYFYQRQFQIYQDSLVNPASIREIEQAKSEYEMNKQQRAADEQLAATRRKILYVVIVAFLLILLVAAVYYAYIGKKKANTELSQKNQVIGAQIQEKELLHKEMHHRVKNNLQLISSIMGLHAQDVHDQKVSNAISEGKTRMEAMTLIHQKLYGKEESTFVELKSYLENLTDNLKTTYSGQIEDITLDAPELNIEADDSIPIGLIVNEAVCNAAKYGAGDQVLVQVSLKPAGQGYELSISDNGPGFPEKELKPGFGTMLISTLAKQLRADLRIVNLSPGTSLILLLKNLKTKELVSLFNASAI